jgi:hypothetical protein
MTWTKTTLNYRTSCSWHKFCAWWLAPEGTGWRCAPGELENFRAYTHRAARSDPQWPYRRKLETAHQPKWLLSRVLQKHDGSSRSHSDCWCYSWKYVDAPLRKPQPSSLFSPVISKSTLLEQKDHGQNGINTNNCSRFTINAPQWCCQWTILRAHKFGTLRLGSLFDDFRYTQVDRIDLKQMNRYSNQGKLPWKENIAMLQRLEIM